MKLNLYRVDKEFELLFSYIEEQGFNEDTALRLNDALKEFDVTALNIGSHYKNMQAKISLMKQYEKEMSEKRKILEAEADKFESFLKSNMLRFGVSKVDGPEISITTKRTKSSVKVLDANLDNIAAKHVRTKVIKEIDKEAIRRDIENGEVVEYAQLVDNYSLTIK